MENKPLYNSADTYAELMIDALVSVVFLVGLYKGSGRSEHLKAANEWIESLEANLSSLRRELNK